MNDFMLWPKGLSALAVAGICGALSGQPPRAAIESPAVREDGQIRFQVLAPAARSLHLNAPWAGGSAPFEPGRDGIWSLTIGPLPPGIYSYTLELDGVRILDPHNTAIKRWSGGNASLVEVPADKPTPYDLRDVPHGAVHAHRYHSPSGQANRRILVYTPPDYETQPDRSYPTLYLLHGSGDDESTWTDVGRANLILDNLIADGEAEPMLVAMPNGHPIPWSSRRRGLRAGNTEAFRKDLMGAAVPLVETLYRTRPGPEHRAIAGLSMGGGQALHAGAGNLGSFAWIGAFSSAAPNPREDQAMSALLADPTTANGRLRLLWIAIGRDDFLLERNVALKADLDKAGVAHEWLLTEGAHNWRVWRDYLARFVPLLFRSDPP